MPESFLAFRDGDFEEGSASWAYELSAFVRRYGALHPGSFAGTTVEGGIGKRVVVARFVGRLDNHEAALDRRVVVRSAERTVDDLRRIRAELNDLLSAWPGVAYREVETVAEDDRVRVEIEVADSDCFRDAMRSRFGTAVRVVSAEYYEAPQRHESWTIGPDDRDLTVHFVGGASDSLYRLDLIETEQQVTVTVVAGHYRTTTLHIGAGWSRSITARLAASLGNRSVVDGAAGARDAAN